MPNGLIRFDRYDQWIDTICQICSTDRMDIEKEILKWIRINGSITVNWNDLQPTMDMLVRGTDTRGLFLILFDMIREGKLELSQCVFSEGFSSITAVMPGQIMTLLPKPANQNLLAIGNLVV